MDMEFAYSRGMQILLAAQTYITYGILMYLIANLMLQISDQKASVRQKTAFAFWVGCVFYSSSIYLVYLFGGNALFTPLGYTLIVTPNPLLGYLYYIVGCKTLKLSPVRSIKLMSYFYTYFIFVVNLTRLFTAMWPIETMPRYNYLQNAERQAAHLVIIVGVYFLTRLVFKKTKFRIELADSLFVNLKKERIVYLCKLLFQYALTTSLPLLIADDVLGSLIVIFVLAFFFSLNIMIDRIASLKAELDNKKVHIKVLSTAVSDFSGIRHDLNNILQTYGGYIEIGSIDGLRKYHASVSHLAQNAGISLDIGHKMEENPALISTLTSKLEYAERVDVEMVVSLQCSTNELYMDSLDLCRCVACLLDNAIESAAESEQKRVFFTLEQKLDGSKLMIITNNTARHVDIAKLNAGGGSSKHGHHGLGLANVKKILAKYGNYAFNMTYFNHEFSAYLELRED